jgi:hypothetical protein
VVLSVAVREVRWRAAWHCPLIRPLPEALGSTLMTAPGR